MSPLHRFVDRDAFARFGGIGVGCQHFQATQVLNIRVGPDHVTDTPISQNNGADSAEDDDTEDDDDTEGDTEAG